MDESGAERHYAEAIEKVFAKVEIASRADLGDVDLGDPVAA
jgi:hypothetical protein